MLESNPDEAGYFLSECKGEGGYKLRVIESDLRQTIEVIAPDGKETGLNLSSVTGGGFSHLGKNVEWRGAVKDGVFAPDALIVRHEVVTNPEGTESESGWLRSSSTAHLPDRPDRTRAGPEHLQGPRRGGCRRGVFGGFDLSCVSPFRHPRESGIQFHPLVMGSRLRGEVTSWALLPYCAASASAARPINSSGSSSLSGKIRLPFGPA